MIFISSARPLIVMDTRANQAAPEIKMIGSKTQLMIFRHDFQYSANWLCSDRGRL
jgi:hypothetical protein